MRIQYKGGVWKNTEDEILKVAVMKYGKNQWPRIASLLVRKSAKQCKARWHEWLDPSIKKTEWTREEEAKLLHLAKVMPTAWRTIAPMIGRTAAQCIEHYEKLIDAATRQQQQLQDGTAVIGASSNQGGGSGVGASGSALKDGVGMSSIVGGEMVPESKPARPDPVDMDEDELEMLSEARARLANTKGKKAKRKAREKHLEAAKRVARLQKMRELKAAGVPLKKKTRHHRKTTDYATEIPFMRTPAAGFYDTREEDEIADAEAAKKRQIGQLLSKYKGKSADEAEEELREGDRQKRKKREKEQGSGDISDFAWSGAGKETENKEPFLKLSDLKLPEPLMSDLDLVKLGKPGALQKQLDQQRNGADEEGERDSVDGISEVKSATTGTWALQREKQVREIMSERNAQTPLHGGETRVSNLRLDGRVTPAISRMQTPNLSGSSFIGTTGGAISAKAKKREEKKKQKERMRRLSDMVRKGLSELPDPENEYQFDFGAVGDDENNEDGGKEEDETDGGLVETVQDAEEELRRRERKERERVPVLGQRLLSGVAKRELPTGTVWRRVSGGSGLIDTGSVEFVVERDDAVKRIMKEFEEGTMKAHEALNELESLVATDGSDDAKLVQGATDLVEAEMKNGGEEVRKGIEQVVDQEFSVKKRERKSAVEVVDKDYEQVEDIFQQEAETRRQSIGGKVGTIAVKDERPETKNLEKLWTKVEKYYGKDRICKEAAMAMDEPSILKVIASLQSR